MWSSTLAQLVLVFLANGLRMTREVWCSGTLAAIFALHPLHVESVAWISERKDVLSTFLLMLTLLLYARYVEKPRPSRYLWMFTAFALSLLAKPMAVTFPFVLLLIDIWPLRHCRSGGVCWRRRRCWQFRRWQACSLSWLSAGASAADNREASSEGGGGGAEV